MIGRENKIYSVHVSEWRDVTGGSERQYAGNVRHQHKPNGQEVADDQHTKRQLHHFTVFGTDRQIGTILVRQRYAGRGLVRADGVDTSEDHYGACHGDKHEQQEEAVAHTEDGERKVVVIFNPVVAAAQETQGEGQDAHEETEDYCSIQSGTIH